MTHRHARKCFAAQRSSPLINLSDYEIISMIENHVVTIRNKFKDTDKQRAFSVGIDATVIMKTCQDASLLVAIVGGVYLSHCNNVTGELLEDLRAIIKACLVGYCDNLADEVKVAVVSFKETPLGMCPYLVLAGNAQTINESNDFAKWIIKLCQQASVQVGNCIVLSQSTDRVLGKVEWNKHTVSDFLAGDCNVCTLPKPNHNAKIGHYQQFGGSCAAVIGHYVINLWLLLEAGVVHELIRPQDYSYYSVVLSLFSHDSVKQIIQKDSLDAGNGGFACYRGNDKNEVVYS
jgi:hypothetical protein